jgi:hypothetical protein
MCIIMVHDDNDDDAVPDLEQRPATPRLLRALSPHVFQLFGLDFI